MVGVSMGHNDALDRVERNLVGNEGIYNRLRVFGKSRIDERISLLPFPQVAVNILPNFINFPKSWCNLLHILEVPAIGEGCALNNGAPLSSSNECLAIAVLALIIVAFNAT